MFKLKSTAEQGVHIQTQEPRDRGDPQNLKHKSANILKGTWDFHRHSTEDRLS